ncbi:hypothetical protein BJ944DRAFT_273636, partial [Cunninghamella echinulata]
MTLALSPNIPFNNNNNNNNNTMNDKNTSLSQKEEIKETLPPPPKTAQEILISMVDTLEREDLKQAMKLEIKRILVNHEQLVTILQSRTDSLEQQTTNYKSLLTEQQKKYEKAVREMKFFRKKYEVAMEMNKQYVSSIIQQRRPRSLSIESNSTNGSNTSTPTPPSQQQKS